MPGGTHSVAITRYTPLYVYALALPGRLSRLWFLPAPPHRVGGGLGLTCAKAAKSKACAILVSKLHKSCFFNINLRTWAFLSCANYAGALRLGKIPHGPKIGSRVEKGVGEV